MKKATMYIMEDNGGRKILFNYCSEWYVCDCAPSDVWGDVELHQTIDIEEDGVVWTEDLTLETIADKLRQQNAEYTDYCAADFTDDINCIGSKVSEWSGLDFEELERPLGTEYVLVGEVEVAD